VPDPIAACFQALQAWQTVEHPVIDSPFSVTESPLSGRWQPGEK
jgi:hypothetical protein